MEALALMNEGFLPHVIVSDQRMPKMSGAEFLAASRAIAPNAVRVTLTGYADLSDVMASVNNGFIYRFLTKPWGDTELLEAIRLCFEQYDITTRNDELTALNNEKNEFLGIVAHDLKNPLNAIMNMAEMMRSMSDDIDETMRMELLTHIVTSSERMFAIITNLLDVNALERGGFAFNLVAVNIATQAAFITDSHRARAESKGITLDFEQTEQQESGTPTVRADETALQQILENLISNAVKFSPHGKNIFVRIKPSSEAVRVEIQDEGPGLSDDDKSKLFGKFARLSAQPTGGEHSTGLGLNIVKKMVEAMGGRVWCESELGRGAMFIVELPKA
jgi:two-component system, sensor histidine kinase and response regulator